jgi:carboxyl-terminal processing protease
MKILYPSLACSLLLAFRIPAGCASAPGPTPNLANASGIPNDSAKPTSSQLVADSYRAIVRDSIIRIDPHKIARAALAARAGTTVDHPVSLPNDFGRNAERDATWLAAGAPSATPPWQEIDAMTRAAATAHLWLVTPQRRAGMRGLGSGERVSTSGFSVYPLEDGRLVVFDVIPGASADVSGLRTGDIILQVNHEPATRQLPMQMVALAEGEEIILDVVRGEHPNSLILKVNKIEMSPVETQLLEQGVGYVRLRWFARAKNPEHDTAVLARRAIVDLAKQGARGLVLDLRSALGGTGEVSIASALTDGEVIYFLQQPIATAPRAVKREGLRCWPETPIVILVNELTISAGEALALSLRELCHARIIGHTTGGGLTEFTPIPLAEGYALTIPTGVVLGPITARDQPDHAVKPDLEIASPTVDELVSGRDRQLDAALAELTRR